MLIVKCEQARVEDGEIRRQTWPRGSTYIGFGADLHEPYWPESTTKKASSRILISDDRLLERMKRSVSGRVANGSTRAAMRALGRGEVLACPCLHCDSREAIIVRPSTKWERPPCHGDVIATVWEAMEAIGWRMDVAEPMQDLAKANAIWGEVYELAFDQVMTWGQRSDEP